MLKRTNSLLATKFVREILVNAPQLAQVKEKIYCLDAKLSTTYPFVVITRSSVSAYYRTKDLLSEDTVGVTIDVASDSYEKGVILANEIRYILEKNKFQDTDNGVDITDITLLGCSEQLYSEAFIQTLSFQLTFR